LSLIECHGVIGGAVSVGVWTYCSVWQKREPGGAFVPFALATSTF